MRLGVKLHSLAFAGWLVAIPTHVGAGVRDTQATPAARRPAITFGPVKVAVEPRETFVLQPQVSSHEGQSAGITDALVPVSQSQRVVIEQVSAECQVPEGQQMGPLVLHPTVFPFFLATPSGTGGQNQNRLTMKFPMILQGDQWFLPPTLTKTDLNPIGGIVSIAAIISRSGTSGETECRVDLFGHFEERPD